MHTFSANVTSLSRSLRRWSGKRQIQIGEWGLAVPHAVNCELPWKDWHRGWPIFPLSICLVFQKRWFYFWLCWSFHTWSFKPFFLSLFWLLFPHPFDWNIPQVTCLSCSIPHTLPSVFPPLVVCLSFLPSSCLPSLSELSNNRSLDNLDCIGGPGSSFPRWDDDDFSQACSTLGRGSCLGQVSPLRTRGRCTGAVGV